MAEKRLRRAIAIIAVMAFMIPLMTPKVFAASGISVSGGDFAAGGEIFSVRVEFVGDNIGRVDGQLIYDTSKLTYISGGSSSGNSGFIQLKKAGTGEAIAFNIKFQAIGDGSTELTIDTNEIYDLNEHEMEPMSYTKKINVSGNAAQEEKITETQQDEESAETTKRMGVDEKPQPTEKKTSTAAVLAIATAVIIVLLAVVATLLRRSRKRRKQN